MMLLENVKVGTEFYFLRNEWRCVQVNDDHILAFEYKSRRVTTYNPKTGRPIQDIYSLREAERMGLVSASGQTPLSFAQEDLEHCVLSSKQAA